MSTLISVSTLLTLVRPILGLLFLFASTWIAYLLVRRGLATKRVSARWMATLAVTLAIQHGFLNLLDAFRLLHLHLFKPWIALPVALIVAVLAHRVLDGRGACQTLREDIQQAGAASQEIFSSWVHRLLTPWAALAAGARALAGIVSPPLTWDTLTYHAFKSAEWVQYGYKARSLAPDQWGYCTYYHDGAEVPAAWSMLFLKSDLGLPFVGIAIFAACAFAVYALARSFDAARNQAFRASILTAFLPALLGEMVSGYADMFVLLAFLALGLALVLLFRHRERAEALLLGTTAGLLASTKFQGLPVALLALLAVSFVRAEIPARLSRSRLCLVLLASTAALAMAGPHYLAVWIERGSPLYPFPVTLGGIVLSEGNPQLRALFSGELGVTDPRWASGLALLQSLVLPYSLPKEEFIGFGPALLILAPLGLCGLLTSVTGRSTPSSFGRSAAAFALMLFAFMPILAFMSKDFAGQRALSLPNLGRLLLPLPATLAVLGARLEHWGARGCTILAILLTMLLAWPAGVANPMLDAIESLAPWFVLALAAMTATTLAFLRHPALKDRTQWFFPSTIAIAAIILVVPLTRIRQESRFTIYQAAAAPTPAFIMHFTWPQHASAWPLWRALDDGEPHRIHASYGWDGLGHNGLRYPLLGSRLQNRVFYVPITKGRGPIIDYRNADQVRHEADEGAWLERLRQARIDRVFLGEPPPPEKEFVLHHPERFQLLERGQNGLHALYRFIP